MACQTSNRIGTVKTDRFPVALSYDIIAVASQMPVRDLTDWPLRL